MEKYAPLGNMHSLEGKKWGVQWLGPTWEIRRDNDKIGGGIHFDNY